jgi:hypothetical protein
MIVIGLEPAPIVIASGISDVEAVLRVIAHRMRHDDRHGAGDGNETDLDAPFLWRGALREYLRRRTEPRNGRSRISSLRRVDILRHIHQG